MLNVARSGKTAPWFEKELAARGLLGKAMGDELLRFTTYRGVTRKDIAHGIEVFKAFMRDEGGKLGVTA